MPVPNYVEFAMDVLYAPEEDVDVVPTKIPPFAECMTDMPQNLFLETIETATGGGYWLRLDPYSQVDQVVVQVLGDEPLVIRWRDARTAAILWSDLGVSQPNEVNSICHLDPTYGLYLFCATSLQETRAHLVIYGRR